MKRDLTRKYAKLFEKKGIGQLATFLGDVFKTGKSREMFSFMVWEVMHRLHLFPQNNYLTFNPARPITLFKDEVCSTEFEKKIKELFASQGLRASRVEQNWKIMYVGPHGEMVGCQYPDDRALYKSLDGGRTAHLLGQFPEKIKGLFISSQGAVFVSILGAVYRSPNLDGPFERVFEFATPQSFFRHGQEMCETPGGMLLVGEYGNVWDEKGWRKIANLYASMDGGETWKKSDFLIQKGVNKHVHIIKYSPLLDRLLLADGDNKKKFWLSASLKEFDFDHPQWTPITRTHLQTGGYISYCETSDTLFLGTDYQGGTNFIITTTDGKKFKKKVVPDPYRRSPIDNLILRRARSGMEIWANLPYSTSGTKSLLMASFDQGHRWNRLFEYKRDKYSISLICQSAGPQEQVYFSILDVESKDRSVWAISDQGSEKSSF